MALKPKYTLEGFKTVASREFTDREEFVDSFLKNLQTKEKDTYSVLVYYGVGGVGKTSLRKKLNAILKKDYEDHILGILDFDVADYREPETGLYVLRKNLSEKYKIPFPIFDIAYSIYWKKINPTLPLSKETFPLLEQGGIVADLISIISDVPVVGMVPKILNFTFKGKETLTKYIHSMKNELYNLQHLEPNDIVQRLPLYLASDLKKSIDATNKNIVIFIDTYEALWEGKKMKASFSYKMSG